MKVNIPKQIKIAARNYTVIRDKHLIRNEADRGRCSFHQQCLYLDGGLEGDMLNVTFLHELLHALDEHFCGRQGIAEDITCGLAEGLYQFLKDNLEIEFSWEQIDGD